MLKSKNFMEEESEDKQYWKLHCWLLCPSEKHIIELDGDPHCEYHKSDQPPRPQTAFIILWLSLCCGHPSFKSYSLYTSYYLT
jgi:hypothetical protein